MWYWLFKYIFMGPLLTFLGRPKVEGLEHVPLSGPAILASNHLAVADSFYLPLVVRRRITFLAKSEYFTGKGLKGRLQAWFYTVAGQVPIDRTDADAAQAALDTAQRLLDQGKLLGMYPEGTRSPGRPVVQGQDGSGPVGAGDRRPGDPGRHDRNRRRQPARVEDVAVRQGDGSVRRADGLLPLRRTGRQPVHRAGRHRRGDVRADEALRPGIRRHLRRDDQEGRPGRHARGTRSADARIPETAAG